MPSVDRQRLEREIDRALNDPDQAQSVRAALRDLFEFYGTRPRHAPAQAPLDDSSRSYGVPAFVIDRVVSHLLSLPLPDEMRAALVNELWATGYREQRQVAIEMLCGAEPAEMLSQALVLARDMTSTSQLETLSEKVLEAIRASDPDAHWQTIEKLIKEDDGNLRTLGLCALEMASRDRTSEILPRIYECLEGIGAECHGREATAYERLIETLAARHPLEVVRFLEDEMRRSPHDRRAKRLLAKVKTGLPRRNEARQV